MSATLRSHPDVLIRTTRLLYRNAVIGQAMSMLIGSLLCYGLRASLPVGELLGWLLPALSFALVRIGLARAYARAPADFAHALIWRRRYLIGTAIVALWWGGGALAFMFGMPPAPRLIVSLVICGMVAGAVPILSPVLPALRFYAVMLVLPVTLTALAGGEPYDPLIAAMSLLFLYTVLRSAGYFNEMLSEAIELEIEKGRLADDLKVATAEAQAASRAKSEFLANISHEIRTPMNGIVGMAQLLSQQPLDDASREQVTVISSSTDALLTLVNDVLDLSRIEAGHFNLAPVPFSPQELVESLARMFGPQAQLRGLTLHWPDAALADALYGDPVRLKQIFVNLIGNALKFTPQGAITVRLTLTPREADVVELHASVADTGIGVPPEQIGRIFEAFSQADSSISRQYGGTGLGLSISRRLVRMMQGELWVDANPGGGSVFHFTAMLLTCEASALPSRPPAARPLVVLVAEDNPVNRLVAERLLEAQGHSVRLAHNGQQAIEAARAGGIDLILMDLQMPELDGLSATRLIRSAEALTGRARLPIVALSANGIAEEKTACLLAGMDDFLEKPLQQEALARLLSRVSAGEYAGR
ncbi:ATP-binding protein [Jeongeupia sp. USM3]|uniref:ATP-binding protein n=1 Tax=Jeongeupia sp. USM3 TaxID=1906741 RepID=UPI00089DECF1|nr:ATP-binding protein [Jeongeupia sp. USM3]AOY01829.1 hypothetical protein BJP62_16055 [Jeongeupia sp. USM3]